METKDLINSIYSLLKLEIDNEIKIENNEIIICFDNDIKNKIKLTKIA